MLFDILKPKAKRNWIVWTSLPDGLNYFQGIHAVNMPQKFGVLPVNVNLWTIHFEDLKEHAGLFTKDEAEFYLANIGMDGCYICTYDEAVEKRKSIQN